MQTVSVDGSDEGATAYGASKVICCKLTHLNLP